MNKQLIDILDNIVAPGRFHASGQLSDVELKLDIKNLGPVGTPIAPRTAKQIIAQCQQAPYGLGSKTLVDTSVRKVWELGSRKFKILSPEWKTQLPSLLEKVAKQLGLEDQTIKAQLYKLLVYEQGSFFLPHRDTEKTDGMFASLIISLPSQHTGGTLIIDHNGEQKKISFGGKKSATTLQYTSFYADCSHEVKPLTSGYRICLVYNLSLPQKTPRRRPSQNENVQQDLEELLQTWAAQAQPSDKRVILFDHQYTAAQLALKHLKGKDFGNGQLLYDAAQKADCEVHLALLSYHENGMPSGGDDSYDSYYDYDDDDNDDIDVDAEMEEIYDEDIEVKQWFTPGGRKKQLGQIDIDEGEIIAKIDFKDKPANESEYEGYMGNYGPSLDRWYHRAGLVIWPKKHTVSILVQAGPSASVPDLAVLTEKIAKAKKSDEKAKLLQQAQAYASAIIAHGKFETDDNSKPLQLMLALLPTLQNEALAKVFFQTVFSHCFYGDEGKSLATFLAAFGWKTFEVELVALFETHTNASARLAQLLKGLYENIAVSKGQQTAPPKTDELAVLSILADRFADNLEALDKSNRTNYLLAYYDTNNNVYKQRIELIESLLESCFPLFTPSALTDLVRYFTTTPAHYPLHEVLIPLLQHYAKPAADEHSHNRAINDLVTQILALLRQRTAKPIQIPDHWTIEASWDCSCHDCATLKEFLADATSQSLHIGMGKPRRKHIHRVIDSHVVDVSHDTIRRGSPFTLVLKKNRNSYRKKQILWEKEREVLQKHDGQ